MIQFEVTKDAELITSIMYHPAIFPWITDDVSSQLEIKLIPGVYVLVKDENELLGFFSVHTFSGTAVQVHAAFLPNAWGNRTKESVIQATKWIFNQTGVHKIIGFIPESNIRMLSLVKKCGWKCEGYISDSFLKNDKYHNLVIMTIEGV